MNPRWVEMAKKDIGLTEIKGQPTSPKIVQWLKSLGAWWADDEVPWCGTAMAAWMTACGIKPPKAWYRAMAWSDWGSPLSWPIQGCVVVFSRKGGGHVGLVVGETPEGNLLVLGGNQGDAVRVSAFSKDRVTAYRWPPNEPMHDYYQLAKGDGDLSKSEA